MAKELKFGDEAKKKLLEGVDIVTRAVGSTLGPKANNVAIHREYGAPIILHDGVRVAQEIYLKDKFADAGAQLIIDAARKTNDTAGDGTTTATILTNALAVETYRNITAGSNARIIKKGVEKAKDAIIGALKGMAKPIKTPEEIKQVASISAQDSSIGELISEAKKKLGNDCIIAVEESKSTETYTEYKTGMEFDKGYVSPHFVNKPELGEAEVNDPWILIYNGRLNAMPEFVAFLQNLAEIQKEVKRPSNNLVIIANEVSGLPLTNLVANKMQGVAQIVAVTTPAYGEHKKDLLEDIAAITGGKVIDVEAGMRLGEMKFEDFGFAKKVIASKDSTVIVDGDGDKELIDLRVKFIKKRLDKVESEFDKEKLEERLAKLTSGIAILNVGAVSETEMRNKKEGVIDAINSTKAAIEEGIVSGGETALMYAANQVEYDLMTNAEYPEEKIGIDILLKAIKQPFKTLMENSGYDSGQMLERFEQKADIKKNIGFDVMDGELKDLVKSGIVDPVKVTRSALENAVSIAMELVVTGTVIIEIKEEKDKVIQ